MNLIEKATIIHYHRHRIDAFGEGTVGALGWRHEESQVKRFEALSSVGNLNGVSLMDIGCGYGHLKGFLDERFHGFSYIGIDQMPEFISGAIALYGQRPSCYFCLADFTSEELPRVDYIFASGVLGYRCEAEDFLFSMIGKMFAAADRALAFNMLDAAIFPRHELLTGHDPEEVLAFCRTLSPEVKLVRDYLEDDFTVLMYRDR
jgi:trans-aconitate methyltransferase